MGSKANRQKYPVKSYLPWRSTVWFITCWRIWTLIKRPTILREIILATPGTKTVVIDEIQRIPELLNEIHWLITNTQTRFVESAQPWTFATPLSVCKAQKADSCLHRELSERWNCKWSQDSKCQCVCQVFGSSGIQQWWNS